LRRRGGPAASYGMARGGQQARGAARFCGTALARNSRLGMVLFACGPDESLTARDGGSAC